MLQRFKKLLRDTFSEQRPQAPSTFHFDLTFNMKGERGLPESLLVAKPAVPETDPMEVPGPALYAFCRSPSAK